MPTIKAIVGWKVFLLAFLFTLQAFAQTSTSTVRGTVTDQSGSVVPRAVVELVNQATNTTTRAETNDAGLFIFPSTVPGLYRVRVSATGMQTYEAALNVQVQQDVALSPVLAVGQTSTVVEVEDITPLITTGNATLGNVLERRRIEQLPINGRFIQNLLQTIPGMEGTRAYGMRDGSHEFSLDGASLSDRMNPGIQRRPPGLDTIQEFKVETNNSSAAFSRPVTVVMSTKSGTNQIHGSLFETHRNNAIGKARARTDFYEKAPPLIRNEYGGSLGGPLVLPKIYDGRNRTFWFFAYEGFRNVAPSTDQFSVPTEAMRRGDFRGLVDAQGRQIAIYDPYTTNAQTWQRQQFSHQGQLNVIDPARINPLAKYLYEVTPLPTHPEVNPLVASNWFGPTPSTERQWTLSSRFDHNFSDKDRVYARYSQGDYWQFRDFGSLPTLDGIASTKTTAAPNKSLAASWSRVVSPTLFNELVVSVSREQWYIATGDPDTRYADKLGLPNPFQAAGWPGLYDTGLNGLIYETENTTRTPFSYYIVDNNMSKMAGRHELRFGGHFRHDQLTVLPPQQQIQGNHNWDTFATALYDSRTPRNNPVALPQTGHNLANMFLGVMNYSNQFVRGNFDMRAREYSAYFQDNFKVTNRLTVNMGVRWEYWPVYKEKNNILVGFDRASKSIVLGRDRETLYQLGATLPAIVDRFESLGAKFITYDQAGQPERMMRKDWKNFGPRLGFAYRAGDGARSFVLRGGYRISYFTIPMNPFVQRMRSNAPLNARFQTSLTSAALSPDGLPRYGMRSVPTMTAGVNSTNAVELTNASNLARGSANISYFAIDQPDPRVHDWNFTIEKEIFAKTVLRGSYVGNHVGRLEQFHTFNDPTPEYLWFATTGQRLPTGEFASVARRSFDQTVYGRIEEYRRSGWSNFNGFQVEVERKYDKGVAFQFFYTLGNVLAAGGQQWSGSSVVPELNQFLPGRVPEDLDDRNRFLNYQRDSSIPKHRLRWNWIVDVPVGRGKALGGKMGGWADKIIGGWQVAGMGSFRTNYFALPNSIYPNGENIEIYGEKYPIQDCRGGNCRPGYLWWNGYIPANQINSVDANGRPNGVMGVPDNYKPAGQPLIPWPKNPDRNDPLFAFYGTNTTWVRLNDGTEQRTVFNDGLHPWRNQFLPGVNRWGLDASLFKTVPITERVMLRFNADFFNVLNMPGNPTAISAEGILNTQSSGQAARELQLTLRLSW